MTFLNACSNVVFLELLDNKFQVMKMRFSVRNRYQTVIYLCVHEVETSKVIIN